MLSCDEFCGQKPCSYLHIRTNTCDHGLLGRQKHNWTVSISLVKIELFKYRRLVGLKWESFILEDGTE